MLIHIVDSQDNVITTLPRTLLIKIRHGDDSAPVVERNGGWINGTRLIQDTVAVGGRGGLYFLK